MTNTIVYHGTEGISELNVNPEKIMGDVGDAIFRLMEQNRHRDELKILASPLIVQLIEANAAEFYRMLPGIAVAGGMSKCWFGVEVSDEYPFNDHILIFHKTLGAFHPELVRRVNV